MTNAHASKDNVARIGPTVGGAAEAYDNRARRLLVHAPTGTSALLLAVCMLLPFGMYGGCGNNSPRPVTPLDRQAEAWANKDVASLVAISLPYGLAAAVALATLAWAASGGPRVIFALAILYATLLGLVCALLAESTLRELLGSDRDPQGIWADHGLAVLTAVWLACMALAAWIDAPSRFVSAMLLQMLIGLIIGVALSQWLLFLDRLLIGGYLTILGAAGILLGTVLQLYGDPAAARQTARFLAPSPDRLASSGTPQFTLRGLLAITTLCAVLLSVCQTWNLEMAILVGYVATTSLLAVRRIGDRHGWLSPRVCGYALATGLLAVGALTL